MIKKFLFVFLIIFVLFSFSCSAVMEPENSVEKKEKNISQDNNIVKEPENKEEPIEEDKNNILEKIGELNTENNEIDIEEEAVENAEADKEKENKIEAPTISLEIIYGPSYAQGGNICFYRIKADVEGNPAPEIIFSSDDSNGNLGKDIAQVNLKKGEKKEIEARAVNEAGETRSSLVLEWKDQDTNKTEEAIDYSNSSNFNISVSLEDQVVRVYHKEELIKEMICSGGTIEDPTPTGTFKTNEKIYYCWLPKYSVGAYYYIRFYGSYLFHSVPFDENGNIIQEEFQKLGSPASHGCIRLKVDDAKWLYETLPLGVEVNIF